MTSSDSLTRSGPYGDPAKTHKFNPQLNILYDPQLFFPGDNSDPEAVCRAGSEQEPTSSLRGNHVFIF